MITRKYNNHEKELLKKEEEEIFYFYSGIINKYKNKFRKHGYSLRLSCYWLNTLKSKHSKVRLPFSPGYKFYILCEAIQEETKSKNFELSLSYNISSIIGMLFFKKIKVNDSQKNILADLNRMLEMIDNL